MADNLVSVIIPSYNRPDRTQRAINSVVAQSYSPIELLVVDDGSSPPLSESISLPHDQFAHAELLTHDENQGANVARNTGINHASGGFISFLDSDDEWKPTKIEQQMQTLANSNSDAVYCGIKHSKTESDISNANKPVYSGKITQELLTKGNFIGSFSSIMVSKKAIEEAGRLDERFPSYQDWEYYIRLSLVTRFEVIDSPLVIRYSGEWEQISDGLAEKVQTTRPMLINKFSPIALRSGKKTQMKFKSIVNYSIGHAALRNNNYPTAQNLFLNSIKEYPFNYKYYIYLVLSFAWGVMEY